MARHELNDLIQRLQDNVGKRVYVTLSNRDTVTGFVAGVINPKKGHDAVLEIRMGHCTKAYEMSVVDSMTTKGIVPKGVALSMWRHMGKTVRATDVSGDHIVGTVEEVTRRNGVYRVAIATASSVYHFEVDSLTNIVYLEAEGPPRGAAVTATGLQVKRLKAKRKRMIDVLRELMESRTRVTVFDAGGDLFVTNRLIVEVGKDYFRVDSSQNLWRTVPIASIHSLEYRKAGK